LNGKIVVLLGNHEKCLKGALNRLNEAQMADGRITLLHTPYLEVDCADVPFILSHYPLRSWNGRNHGTIHLFGHCHGKMADSGLSTDVGVDTWAYAPVSLNTIRKYMEDKHIDPKDSI